MAPLVMALLQGGNEGIIPFKSFRSGVKRLDPFPRSKRFHLSVGAIPAFRPGPGLPSRRDDGALLAPFVGRLKESFDRTPVDDARSGRRDQSSLAVKAPAFDQQREGKKVR